MSCAKQPAFQSGGERKRDGRRVAAGVPDHARGAYLVAEQLAQAVYGPSVQVPVLIFAAVPLPVIVLAVQSEIRAKVDKRLARAVALCGDLLGQAVRQGREHALAAFDYFVRRTEPGAYAVQQIGVHRLDLFS